MVQADRRNSNKAEKKDELVEKLVHINREAWMRSRKSTWILIL